MNTDEKRKNGSLGFDLFVFIRVHSWLQKNIISAHFMAPERPGHMFAHQLGWVVAASL